MSINHSTPKAPVQGGDGDGREELRADFFDWLKKQALWGRVTAEAPEALQSAARFLAWDAVKHFAAPQTVDAPPIAIAETGGSSVSTTARYSSGELPARLMDLRILENRHATLVLHAMRTGEKVDWDCAGEIARQVDETRRAVSNVAPTEEIEPLECDHTFHPLTHECVYCSAPKPKCTDAPTELPARPEMYLDGPPYRQRRVKPGQDIETVAYIEALEAALSHAQEQLTRRMTWKEWKTAVTRASELMDENGAELNQPRAMMQAINECYSARSTSQLKEKSDVLGVGPGH